MKNMMFYLLVLAFCATSCDYEKNVIEVATPEPVQQLSEIEEALKFGMEMIQPNEIVQVSLVDGKLIWNVEVVEENAVNSRAEHDCEGSGMAYIKCVKKHLDAGDCMTTGLDRETGNYWADVTECP